MKTTNTIDKSLFEYVCRSGTKLKIEFSLDKLNQRRRDYITWKENYNQIIESNNAEVILDTFDAKDIYAEKCTAYQKDREAIKFEIAIVLMLKHIERPQHPIRVSIPQRLQELAEECIGGAKGLIYLDQTLEYVERFISQRIEAVIM